MESGLKKQGGRVKYGVNIESEYEGECWGGGVLYDASVKSEITLKVISQHQRRIRRKEEAGQPGG